MKNTDIAIVGMSCFFPGAKNVDEFWNNLINGIDSITDVPNHIIDSVYFQKGNEADTNRFYCKRGGFIPNITIDTEKISFPDIEKVDPTHLLSLQLVYEALIDASVFKKNISLENSSLIIGKSNYSETASLNAFDIIHTGEQIAELIKNALPDISGEDIQKIKKEFQASKGLFNKDTASNLISNSLTSTIAHKLNIKGSAYTIDAACASSLIAVEQSIQELLNGHSDIAIAGGVHFSQNSPFWAIFNELKVLSKKQQIQPFSKNADGLLIGEGAGFVILKKLDRAIADNDKIYAVIKAIGVSNDSSVNMTTPSSEGQKKAILQALQKAEIAPEDISYIEAYGIGTQIGDKTELETLSEVFKRRKGNEKVLLGTVKSNIGHTMSASGMAGLIKTVLSLYHQKIPPTLHCDSPREEMEKTSLIPVQKTMNWGISHSQIAGINAFGFGGINAHAIIEGYAQKRESTPFEKEDVIALTAATKEDLLMALDKEHFPSFNSEHNYRLVLFNPTVERIDKAKKLILKDNPWKGRQDIWFTNKPLLKNNEKIAFLFPGFDPTSEPEVESIADYFGYSIPDDIVAENPLLAHAFKQFRRGVIVDNSLKKLGISPDMNAGHSLGEWFAAKSGGLVSDSSVENLLLSMDPEKYKIDNVYFIAIACGSERIAPWLEQIPDLYLSNNNCPSQVLLCGTGEARDRLIEILKTERVFHQVLTFQSGFHSPFIKDKLSLLDEALEHIEILQNEIPVWSATTLDLYPTNPDKLKKLAVEHLLQPVLFRELIEKLHQKENVKLFIQIGSGTLVGFVDDILKNKEYSAISANVSTRNTLEQLRRVLALLLIEGKNVDLDFLGIRDKQTNSSKEVAITINNNLIKDFPTLKRIGKQLQNQSNSNSLDSLFIDSDHPVIQAMNENIKELILMQSDLAKLTEGKQAFVSTGRNKPTADIQKREAVQVLEQTFEAKTTIISNQGKSFEEKLSVSIEEHPYLIDHSLIKQPKYWKNLRDTAPVIPMTMTFELLIEAAHKQDFSKKVTKLGPVSVYQWMGVADDEPFVQTINGNWKTDNIIALSIKNFANADVTLSPSFPEVPTDYSGHIDLGETILTPPNAEKIYKNHMFHGPGYQGILEVTEVTKKGLRANIKKAEGKGSLLDNVGQLFGLFLQLTLDESSVSFPVKVEELNFYQEISDQQGVFELTCISTSLTDELATADIIIKRNNNVWCIIRGWKNRRFGFDRSLWDLTMAPAESTLGKEILSDTNVFFFNNAYDKAVAWDFINKIYLNQDEKQHYESIQLNKRKDYLISRVAVKDASRSYIKKNFNLNYFPIEFTLTHDAKGKPSLSTNDIKEAKGLEISLAHKGTNSVSIISKKPVGIDIEIIEERDKGFMELILTKKELDLLSNQKNISEWVTRFWVAKEAYGKMLGVGLKGNPKQYEVGKIEGDNLIIGDTTIKTIKYNNNFIIGWTQ